MTDLCTCDAQMLPHDPMPGICPPEPGMWYPCDCGTCPPIPMEYECE